MKIKKGVPNGGTQKSSVSLGDDCSRRIQKETNAAVNKKSSFKPFASSL